MLILVCILGLIAASSGQLDKVLQGCSNGHVIPAKHQFSNGPYTLAAHQNADVHANGHAKKKLANGLANGTYYPNGNGVHA